MIVTFIFCQKNLESSLPFKYSEVLPPQKAPFGDASPRAARHCFTLRVRKHRSAGPRYEHAGLTPVVGWLFLEHNREI